MSGRKFSSVPPYSMCDRHQRVNTYERTAEDMGGGCRKYGQHFQAGGGAKSQKYFHSSLPQPNPMRMLNQNPPSHYNRAMMREPGSPILKKCRRNRDGPRESAVWEGMKKALI